MTQQSPPVLSTALVITGNLIGAGILALPVLTGLAGLWPSLVGISLMWALMTATAIILAGQKSLNESATADLPSFFQDELGGLGRWVAVAANLLILFGVLVAYLSAAGPILAALTGLPQEMMMVGFFLAATTFTLFGMDVLRRGNALIMLLMWGTFAGLAACTGTHMEPARFEHADWGFLPATLPVLVTAYFFHNIIPTVCRALDHDQKAIRTSIVLGSGIGLVMNLVWAAVVIGALPLAQGPHSLLAAFKANLPATVPLAAIIPGPTFVTLGSLFALTALTTSYMTIGVSLESFLRDLASRPGRTAPRALTAALAFLPPLAVALVYPNIFLTAMNVVGGVGIDCIFGILPGMLLWKHGHGAWRALGVGITLAFLGVLVFEVGQELGMTHLLPDAESWTAHLPK